MKTTKNQKSDLSILTLIRANNTRGWEQLYDKYSPLMYGVICTHTSNKNLAEEIFIQLFVRLKKEYILKAITGGLGLYLFRYSYINTRKELHTKQIIPAESSMKANSVFAVYCSNSFTIKQIAAHFGIDKQEALHSLRKELLILRSK